MYFPDIYVNIYLYYSFGCRFVNTVSNGEFQFSRTTFGICNTNLTLNVLGNLSKYCLAQALTTAYYGLINSHLYNGVSPWRE